MNDIFTETYATAFVIALLASAIPVLLAAIGETVVERAGVLGLGLEGLLLTGGFTGFVVTHATGSFWLGFAAGGAAGALLSAVLMVLSVWGGANQIVVGVGITLAGTGITSMLYDSMFAAATPRLGAAPGWALGPLADIPVIGSAVFAQPGMFWIALALPVLVAFWLRRTSPGLRLRAAGQNPAALDAAGGNVRRIRSLAVLFGGLCAGLGGAYLALVSAGTFTPGMTHGMGFLAIVVAMLARGRAVWVAVISLVYGLFVATGTALQFTALNLPNDVVVMAPFVAVLVVLVLFGRRSTLPPALATHYVRGER